MSGREINTLEVFNPPIPARRSEAALSVSDPVIKIINGFFEWFGSLGIFCWKILQAAVTPPYEWRELIRQSFK